MSKKISDLTSATTPLAGTELVEIVQSGTSKKVAASYLVGSGGREVLSAARTYYVRTDGSDSNNGLANTSGGAFLTIQKAVDTICDVIDTESYSATVQVADGTYTGAVVLRKTVGRGVVKILGNVTTPANVIISTTSANSISSNSICEWVIDSLKVQTTTSGWGISVANAKVELYAVNFGACASGHLRIYNHADVVFMSNYEISGAAPVHWQAHALGRLYAGGKTITITGTPAFSTGFAKAYDIGMVQCDSITFSGGATGKRYTGISTCGVINTNGGGASYFPGDTAGDTPTTGGQYA
jgi:hypothetical protein